jgi:hypothetical protein
MAVRLSTIHRWIFFAERGIYRVLTIKQCTEVEMCKSEKLLVFSPVRLGGLNIIPLKS